MKKTIEIIVLFILTIIATVLICRLIYAGKQQIVVKEKEVVKVEGKIKYVVKDKEIVKPYAIVLDRVGDEDWELNSELSYLPMEMSVDSVKTEHKFDILSPLRAGISFDKKPILCYNVANIKGFEAGVMTDFESIGIDVGYRYRNIVPYVGYSLNGKVSFGVVFKPF